MNVTDTTDPAQTDAISLEFDLQHPPQKVWRALTEPALLSDWLLPVLDLDLVPGAAFTFRAPANPGWDGVVNCRVLEIEAERTLSYSWASMGIDTVVTFTLTPADSGTRLSLVQSGFRSDQKRAFGGARYGWKDMGGKLVALLARIP